MVPGLLESFGNKTCKLTYCQPPPFTVRWVRAVWYLGLVKEMFDLWESSEVVMICIQACFSGISQCWTRRALPSHRWFTQTASLHSKVILCHPTLQGHLAQGERYQNKSAFWCASFFFVQNDRDFHLYCQIYVFPFGNTCKKLVLFPRKPGTPKAKLFTFDCSRTIAHSLSIFWLLPPPQES